MLRECLVLADTGLGVGLQQEINTESCPQGADILAEGHHNKVPQPVGLKTRGMCPPLAQKSAGGCGKAGSRWEL